jgi:hypothetical protein
MAGAAIARRRRGEVTAIDWGGRRLIAPIALGAVWLVLVLRWYLPLYAEMKSLGEVAQPIGYFSHLSRILQPLWLDRVLEGLGAFIRGVPRLTRIDSPETVVTVGWVYWVPMLLGAWCVRRRRGGPGLLVLAPFLATLITMGLFVTDTPPFFPTLVQAVVPFMKFFRVASRMGLFLPQVLTAAIVLAWPELVAWGRAAWSRRATRVAAVPLLALALLEFSWVATPVNSMPSLDASARHLFEGVRAAPGDTVLDLPFCVAGGNGVCTAQQCPNYPTSTVGECMRYFHGKKVYGIYQGRLTPAQCGNFDRRPFTSWFDAWREQRCFTGPEWTEFCDYLDRQPTLSAVVVYPGIWLGPRDPACRAAFDAHLGPPIEQAEMWSWWTRGGEQRARSGVLRYAPKCRR